MPTYPLARMVIRVVVEFPAVVEAMVNSGVLAGVLAELEMDRREYGEVVPIPTFPPDAAKYAEPVEPIWVVEAFPVTVSWLVVLFQVRLAALPRRAGVPLVVVQYGSWPAVSEEDVETVPDPPPPVADRVVPSKVRLVPIASDLIALKPLPTKIPPSEVDDAVPPEEIGSAVVRERESAVIEDVAVIAPPKKLVPLT
jgi:hypothetical protein